MPVCTRTPREFPLRLGHKSLATYRLGTSRVYEGFATKATRMNEVIRKNVADAKTPPNMMEYAVARARHSPRWNSKPWRSRCVRRPN
jgi:hypothetical protein